jgi:hypothetical protein
MSSNWPLFASLQCDLCDDAMCAIRRLSFASFEAKLKTPSPTCFTMKQATGCQHMFSHRLHLLVSFEAQTIKPPPLSFEAQTKKLSQWFWGTNHQTVAVVLMSNHQTTDLDFEVQTKKLSHWFCGQTTDKLSPPVLRLNWETRTSCLLHVYDADHTRRHSTSRSFNYRVPDLYLIITDPLHQVSNSCLDPCRYPPCRIRHLHITRQATTFFQTE